MNPPPPSHELLEVVGEFIRMEVIPRLEGTTAFHALVAANVVDIVRRELTVGPPPEAEEKRRLEALLGASGTLADLNGRLCLAIREGAVTSQTPGLVAHLWATTLATLSIAQPNYAAYRREIESIAEQGAASSGQMCAPNMSSSEEPK